MLQPGRLLHAGHHVPRRDLLPRPDGCLGPDLHDLGGGVNVVHGVTVAVAVHERVDSVQSHPLHPNLGEGGGIDGLDPSQPEHLLSVDVCDAELGLDVVRHLSEHLGPGQLVLLLLLEEVYLVPDGWLVSPGAPHPQWEDAGVEHVVGGEVRDVQPGARLLQHLALRLVVGTLLARRGGAQGGGAQLTGRGTLHQGEGSEALQAHGGRHGGRPQDGGQVSEDGVQGGNVTCGHQVTALDSLGLLWQASTHTARY